MFLTLVRNGIREARLLHAASGSQDFPAASPVVTWTSTNETLVWPEHVVELGAQGCYVLFHRTRVDILTQTSGSRVHRANH